MDEKHTSYIVTYIFPQMDSEALSFAHAQLVKTIEDRGVHVVQSRLPALRQLAYPIEKKKSGFMGDVEFWAENPSAVPAVSEALRTIPDILRFLVTRKERPEKKGPSRKPTSYRPSDGQSEERRESAIAKEKVGIEDIDKRLEEIMENVGDT